eukprot:gene14372-22042_t
MSAPKLDSVLQKTQELLAALKQQSQQKRQSTRQHHHASTRRKHSLISGAGSVTMESVGMDTEVNSNENESSSGLYQTDADATLHGTAVVRHKAGRQVVAGSETAAVPVPDPLAPASKPTHPPPIPQRKSAPGSNNNNNNNNPRQPSSSPFVDSPPPTWTEPIDTEAQSPISEGTRRSASRTDLGLRPSQQEPAAAAAAAAAMMKATVSSLPQSPVHPPPDNSGYLQSLSAHEEWLDGMQQTQSVVEESHSFRPPQAQSFAQQQQEQDLQALRQRHQEQQEAAQREREAHAAELARVRRQGDEQARELRNNNLVLSVGTTASGVSLPTTVHPAAGGSAHKARAVELWDIYLGWSEAGAAKDSGRQSALRGSVEEAVEAAEAAGEIAVKVDLARLLSLLGAGDGVDDGYAQRAREPSEAGRRGSSQAAPWLQQQQQQAPQDVDGGATRGEMLNSALDFLEKELLAKPSAFSKGLVAEISARKSAHALLQQQQQQQRGGGGGGGPAEEERNRALLLQHQSAASADWVGPPRFFDRTSWAALGLDVGLSLEVLERNEDFVQ